MGKDQGHNVGCDTMTQSQNLLTIALNKTSTSWTFYQPGQDKSSTGFGGNAAVGWIIPDQL